MIIATGVRAESFMNGKSSLVKLAILITVLALALVATRTAGANGISIGYYNGPNGHSGYSVALGFGGGGYYGGYGGTIGYSSYGNFYGNVGYYGNGGYYGRGDYYGGAATTRRATTRPATTPLVTTHRRRSITTRASRTTTITTGITTTTAGTTRTSPATTTAMTAITVAAPSITRARRSTTATAITRGPTTTAILGEFHVFRLRPAPDHAAITTAGITWRPAPQPLLPRKLRP